MNHTLCPQGKTQTIHSQCDNLPHVDNKPGFLFYADGNHGTV